MGRGLDIANGLRIEWPWFEGLSPSVQGAFFEFAEWSVLLAPAGVVAAAMLLWLAWRDRWFAGYPVSTVRGAAQGRVRLRGALRTQQGHPSTMIGEPARPVAAYQRKISKSGVGGKFTRGSGLLVLTDGTGAVLIPEGSVDLRRPRHRKRWFAEDPDNVYTTQTRRQPRRGLVSLPGEPVEVDEQWIDEGDEVTVMAHLHTVPQEDHTQANWACGYQSGRRGDLVLIYGRDPLSLDSGRRQMMTAGLLPLAAIAPLCLFALAVVQF